MQLLEPVSEKKMTDRQLKLYVDMVTHLFGFASALCELVTGHRPPKLKEFLRMAGGVR